MNPMYAPDPIKADKVYLVRVGGINADVYGSLGHCTLYRAPVAFLSHVDRMLICGENDAPLFSHLPPALPLSEVIHQLTRWTCEACGTTTDVGVVGGSILCPHHEHLGV